MATTYEPIATTTLGSAAASITFSSIPATYTDLKLVTVAQADTFDGYVGYDIQFNSDTGSNYSLTRLVGNGTTAVSARISNATQLNIGGAVATSTTSSNFALSEIDIFNYSGSTYKTLLSGLSGDTNGAGQVRRVVGLWRSTSAITSVYLFADSGFNFKTGTTATLYGIKNA